MEGQHIDGSPVWDNPNPNPKLVRAPEPGWSKRLKVFYFEVNAKAERRV